VGYMCTHYIVWYSGVMYERFMNWNRLFGQLAQFFWALILCNFVAIQPLWFRRVRQSPLALFVISLIVSVGMWLERFVIIIVSLTKDFLRSEEHTSELQSREKLVCRLLLEKKK